MGDADKKLGGTAEAHVSKGALLHYYFRRRQVVPLHDLPGSRLSARLRLRVRRAGYFENFAMLSADDGARAFER